MGKRQKSSALWSFFKVINEVEKIAKCGICQINLSYRSTISNLKHHITKRHANVNIPKFSRVHAELPATAATSPRDYCLPPVNTSNLNVGPGMESSSSSNQMATRARDQYLAMGEMSDPSATPEILPVTQEMQLEFPVTVTPHSPKRLCPLCHWKYLTPEIHRPILAINNHPFYRHSLFSFRVAYFVR
uniref:BED-type domain-containing protein n=1 Tax=Homalodisca liturata TaxID=320908 RepID=A0A1B6JR65_9HEMI